MEPNFQLRNSIVFYRSFFEAINELTPNEQAIMYSAIFDYSFNRREPKELSGLCKAVWTLIKPQIDANIKKFENGLKPKKKANNKQTGSKTEANPKPMRNDNVNYNENVNENGEGGITPPSPLSDNIPPLEASSELIPYRRPGQNLAPTIDQVRQFFDQNGFSRKAADKMYNYYDWTVYPFKSPSNDSTFTDWKQRAKSQWFKEEDKKPKKVVGNGGFNV